MSRRKRPQRILTALAALTLVSLTGSWAVSAARSTGPDASGATTTPSTTATTADPSTSTSLAAPTSTTTPPEQSVVDSTVNPNWHTAISFDSDTKVVDVIFHEDRYYAFAASGAGGGRGLVAWVSQTGETWEPLAGGIGSEWHVNGVISSAFGLIAYGSEPRSGAGRVWTSIDGSAWESVPIDSPWSRPVGVATGESSVLILLSGGAYDDGVIEEALSRHLGFVPPGFIHFEVGGIYQVWVMGPLNIPIRSYSLTELGLTPEDLTDQEDLVPSAWWSSDGTTWSVLSGDEWSFASDLFGGPDGRIWLERTSITAADTGLFASSDGQNWERIGDHIGTPVVRYPSDQFGVYIGSQSSGPGIQLSADGLLWRTYNPGGVMGHNPTWRVDNAAAGPSGLGLVIEVPGQRFGINNRPTGTWTEGSYEFSLRAETDMAISREGVEVLRFPIFGFSDEFEVEYEVGALTFALPDGETATLSAEGIASIESQLEPFRGLQALLFAPASTWPSPGVFDPLRMPAQWEVADLSRWEGVERILVTQSHVVLVTTDASGTQVQVGSIGPN